MRVFKRPRSPYYYFDFDLGGKTHVRSTKLKNEREALNYAAAYRLKLIKQEVGIVEEEKPPVPTFHEFQAQFDAWIDTQHAGNRAPSSSTKATTRSSSNLSQCAL